MKTPILRALPILLGLAAVGAAWAAPVPDSIPLPKGDAILIPLDVGTSAHVIYTATGTIDASEDPILLVDRKGHPWYALYHDRLVNLAHRSMIVADKPFDDVALFPDGTFVLLEDDDMGYLADAAPEQKKQNPHLMAFHPEVKLPYKKMRIFEGDGGTLYLLGKNPEDGKNELFVADSDGRGKRSFVKLVAVKEPIDAVTGDGRTTYFSSGEKVVKIGPERKAMERALKLDPQVPVKQMAYSTKAGLFLVLSEGVAFLGEKGPQMFLNAPDASIRLRNGSLYVLLAKEREILRVDGLDGFAKLLGRR
jgi:hypothetical protein